MRSTTRLRETLKRGPVIAPGGGVFGAGRAAAQARVPPSSTALGRVSTPTESGSFIPPAPAGG